MKILQISSAKNFGGGEKHFVDLCRGLFENGNEIFVALRKQNDWQDRLDFLPSKNAFHIPLRNSLDVFSAKHLANIIKEHEIEILHAHLARDYPIANLAVRMQSKSKLIITRHVLFPMNKIHKLTLGNVSKVIAVSTAVEKNLEKTFPKEKIVCIPNGIDVKKFIDVNHKELNKQFRSSHNIPMNAKLIGTIGELKKLKGQEDFILAANEITKKISNTHFICVGKDNSPNQTYRQKLESIVKNYNLTNKFTFIDWLEDTAPILSSMDVFVSPSHSESFGLAILEAMASGNVVVATETEGAKELIKNDVSGKLVPAKDFNQIAKTICKVLETPEKTKLLRQNAQDFSKENFSLQKMISETEKLYLNTNQN